MEYYDIGEAFKKIEEELMASMIRNLKHHRAEEIEEGFEWSQWQVEQLSALEEYRRRNKKQFSDQFQEINDSIDTLIQLARQQGGMDQEIKILNAIKRGYRPSNTKASSEIMGEFFKVNDRKLNALVEATQNDFKKAEVAMLRMANDKYRKIIYNAQVYANAGGTTYEQAVDMATKDFLRAGINCIEYKNGSRHTMSDYADMCIRTATKRAYLTGEGEKRMEWGESLVIVNKRNAACPKCMRFCGVVLIDDVWSGGKPDGRHQLMSHAIEKGLYHPRCKDIHTTYFPGISTMPDKLSNEEKEKIVDDYNKEQKQNYYERQAEQQERLAKYSLAPENKKKYIVNAERLKDIKTENEESILNIQKKYDLFIEQLRQDRNISFHKSKMAMYAETTDLVEDRSVGAPFIYSSDEDIIKYNPKDPFIEQYNLDYVFVHELSHRMDELEYHSWANQKFIDAIELCTQKVYYNKQEVQEWFIEGGKYFESSAISDIISALTNNDIDVPVGHNNEYWENSKYKAMEIFANLSAIDVLGLDEKEEILEQIFEVYEEMIHI